MVDSPGARKTSCTIVARRVLWFLGAFQSRIPFWWHSIQNTVTHVIGFNSTIEAGDSLLLFMHVGEQGHQRNCLVLAGVSKSLQDIKRILPEVVAGMLGNDSVFHHNDMCHDLMYRECISKTRQRPTQLKDFVSLVHVQSLRSRSAHRSYLGKH